VDYLKTKKEPMSIREILAGTEGLFSQASIYRHIDNLKENEILECFNQRDAFNNPIKKYTLSDEMKEQNTIQLPPSFDIM